MDWSGLRPFASERNAPDCGFTLHEDAVKRFCRLSCIRMAFSTPLIYRDPRLDQFRRRCFPPPESLDMEDQWKPTLDRVWPESRSRSSVSRKRSDSPLA